MFFFGELSTPCGQGFDELLPLCLSISQQLIYMSFVRRPDVIALFSVKLSLSINNVFDDLKPLGVFRIVAVSLELFDELSNFGPTSRAVLVLFVLINIF